MYWKSHSSLSFPDPPPLPCETKPNQIINAIKNKLFHCFKPHWIEYRRENALKVCICRTTDTLNQPLKEVMDKSCSLRVCFCHTFLPSLSCTLWVCKHGLFGVVPSLAFVVVLALMLHGLSFCQFSRIGGGNVSFKQQWKQREELESSTEFGNRRRRG